MKTSYRAFVAEVGNLVEAENGELTPGASLEILDSLNTGEYSVPPGRLTIPLTEAQARKLGTKVLQEINITITYDS